MSDDLVASTALVMAAGGGLLLISSLLSRAGSRLGLPVNLLFLVVGMLAGSEGIGGIWFDSFDVAYVVGTAALVIILFSGGLNTALPELRAVLAPAAVLATVGVLGVAALTAGAARLLGLGWAEALLFGAIVSSTDAAAVIALLDGVPLRRRVAQTLETESGLNDPVAVILTVAATANLGGWGTIGWSLLPDIGVQLVVGAALGLGVGAAGAWLMRRVPLSTPALLPAVALALGLLAYGLPASFGGSGFLAVYLAGIAIGNAPVPYRVNLRRFHDSLAWLAQIAMFLLLGLLVFPSQLGAVAGVGLALALFLAVVARPLVVTCCLLPFGYRWREIACVGWLGLRGAVPIILATLPVLWSNDPSAPPRDALDEFDLVFFVVVVGSFIPGMTVRWLPRLLRLEEPVPPAPAAVVDITSGLPLEHAPLRLYVAPGSLAAGHMVRDLALPDDATVMLIVRGRDLVAPRGPTTLQAGDHVFVLCHPRHADAVRAQFAAADP